MWRYSGVRHFNSWDQRLEISLAIATILILATLWMPVCVDARDPSSETNVEEFDVSGLPGQPTTFLEQQLEELIRYHQPGDLRDAAMIQRKLAQRYREKRDMARAQVAEDRARRAEMLLRGDVEEPPLRSTPPEPAPEVRQPAPGGGQTGSASGFSGKYYGYVGDRLETWDFNPDGTFLHRSMLARSAGGTSTSTSERGTFRLLGQYLELTVTKEATAYSAPSIDSTPSGRRGTVVGGGSDEKAETRRLPIQLLGRHGEQGIILNGVTLKVKKW